MNKIEFGDCRETMRRWVQEGVKAQTCVTSPPYYGLRDYGTAKYEGGDPNCEHTISGYSDNLKPDCDRPDRDGSKRKNCIKCGATRIDNQIGLEETPEEYIAAMVEVFRCVWDVLADDGTLWLNIGDSYNAYKANTGGTKFAGFRNQPEHRQKGYGLEVKSLKNKDLIGIPWMLAFALRADGWYLRQDIIWHKPNPMPESVRDRCTKAHEYIFLLSKSDRYYFDSEAMKEPATNAGKRVSLGDKSFSKGQAKGVGVDPSGNGLKDFYDVPETRNRRSVWTVTTKPYKGAHFATFPPDLIEPCILAGSRPNDIVLDPFMGSGTTAQVASQFGRQYLGCELNPDYEQLQRERLKQPQLELA